MPEILVVEDSEFDRYIVERVFRAIGNWAAEFVGSGDDALIRLQEKKFDLILADLHMPRMNGLELLKRVQERGIQTPVVIMTGKGSEDLAIQALRNGAANYIVKKMLVLELPGIIQKVMQAADSSHQESRLLQHIQQAHLQFELPNEAVLVRAVVPFVQDTIRRMGLLCASELTILGIGLEEALSNARIHGNLEVSSLLRELDSDAYERQIAERMKQAPYCDRRIAVSMSTEDDFLTFCITDQGPGFDQNAIPDPTDPENLFRPCGRGLFLIRSFMDEVSHNACGNQITLKKRIRTPAQRSQLTASSPASQTREKPSLELCAG
jgi:CheY-like chemotaxis protein